MTGSEITCHKQFGLLKHTGKVLYNHRVPFISCARPWLSNKGTFYFSQNHIDINTCFHAALAIKNKHKFFYYQYVLYLYPYHKFLLIHIYQSHHMFFLALQSFHLLKQQYDRSNMTQS